MGHNESHQNGGGQIAIAYQTSGNCGAWEVGDMTGALDTNTDPNSHVITLAIRGRGDSHDLEYRKDGTANAVLTPNGGRGGIGVGAVAYNITPSQSNKDYKARPTQRAQAVTAGGNRPSARGGDVIAETFAVRRLTPRECERLQGAPEVTKHVMLRVCSDLQNSAALAGTKNLKSPKFAWSADGRVLALRAPNAEALFNTPLPALAKRAAASVLIDLERGEVQLRRPGESPISASIADARERLGLAVPGDVFVRLVVHMTSILASEIRTGAVASPPNTTPSIPRLIGSGCAVLCGREISALAADAVRLTSAAGALKSITSPDGGNPPNSGWTSATSSFCVAAAMSGFIPAETHAADFYDLSIEITGGWTNIAYRGKNTIADGPRYKMIGNSWAVPCVRWIGERIELVDGNVLNAESVASKLSRDNFKDGVSDTAAKAEE
jgi:hypothetical protein